MRRERLIAAKKVTSIHHGTSLKSLFSSIVCVLPSYLQFDEDLLRGRDSALHPSWTSSKFVKMLSLFSTLVILALHQHRDITAFQSTVQHPIRKVLAINTFRSASVHSCTRSNFTSSHVWLMRWQVVALLRNHWRPVNLHPKTDQLHFIPCNWKNPAQTMSHPNLQ